MRFLLFIYLYIKIDYFLLKSFLEEKKAFFIIIIKISS